MLSKLANRAPAFQRLPGNATLIKPSLFGFARYYNKAQAAALGMKDNMLSYEFTPDQMVTLAPSPQYTSKALVKPNADAQHNKDNVERFRTSLITKR